MDKTETYLYISKNGVFQPQPELRARVLSTTIFYIHYNLLPNYFLLHIPVNLLYNKHTLCNIICNM